jgi:centromeric protein E
MFLVAIRMRPLNHIEGDKRRVWKVLPKYSSVTQTTRDGKPLPERVIGRTFFTFDKTFGEDANTARVYADVAQGIVTSVVNGLNGTIFAYGQTSSGKTHTMQGSGTIQSGSTSNDEGGIVHMAAKDIFSQIEQHANDRIFLVRASFLEIYNEEVRDLLSPGNPTLHIREDPKRGVFVQSVEEIVTDFESLLRILFEGEKSRAFAATAMNERSSRSHTIFRVTIESRQKGGRGGANDGDESDYNSDEENNDPNGDGAVRVATLNLVDLAGSESVRHTGATGERKKEGAMINQRYERIRE